MILLYSFVDWDRWKRGCPELHGGHSWTEHPTYQKTRRAVKVADGESMIDRFSKWQEQKDAKVEQARQRVKQDKEQAGGTPQLSRKSRQLLPGREGNVVENLHRWEAEKHEKRERRKTEGKKMREDLQREQELERAELIAAIRGGQKRYSK